MKGSKSIVTKRLETVILLIGWGSLVWFMSGQSYEEQDLRPFLRTFDLTWVDTLFHSVQFTYASREISVSYLGPAAFLEFFIRKGAHFFVFAIFGFLLIRLFTCWHMHSFFRISMTIIFILLAASIDEFRHFLHPGRTGLLADVLIDFLGGLFGIIMYSILYRLKYSKKDSSY